MTAHDLKIQTRWLNRVRSGEKRAEVREHDRDYQAGDVLNLVEVNAYGSPVTDWVDRDERGRFVNEWRQRPSVPVRVTHVLLGRHAAGIDNDFCVLSIELIEGGGPDA